MTLTEEQRAAIEYAISSLEQCGSEPEDPVVAKILQAMIDSSEDADYESLRCENCGKTLKEIRGSKYAGDYRLREIRIDPGQEASISDPPIEPSYYFWCDECKNDSSEHFSERTKLIPGFDLERIKADLGDIGDPRFCDCEVRTQLAAAIAEIERLRAENEEALESLTAAYLLGSHKKAQEMAARIKELEASLDDAEALTKKNAELMNGYLRRIAELEASWEEMCNRIQAEATESQKWKERAMALEDALVEERAGAIRCEFYDHCEIDLPDAMIRARQELQAEGKIGNSEHFTDASKMIWQITEERMRVIRMAEELAWDCKAVAVLRAMLTEAGQ